MYVWGDDFYYRRGSRILIAWARMMERTKLLTTLRSGSTIFRMNESQPASATAGR